jgi:hypothetical protein
MRLHVFRMRQGGQRRAGSDPALRVSVLGWLEFVRSDGEGPPAWEAHLRSDRGGHDIIPPIYYAHLRRVDGVMHLVGREEIGRPNPKAKVRLVAQSWLCAIDPAEALPLLRRVVIDSVTGFSPEDDDFGE